MKRSELEHLIRAAAAITNQYEIVVVGSQSILGAFPDAPDSLLLSRIQNSNTDLKIGYCLEPHDLAVSKLVAGREKDLAFVEEMLRHLPVEPSVLKARLQFVSIPEAMRVRLRRWLDARCQERE